MSEVVIVDSGVANLASVAGALRRLGAEVRISGDAAEVHAARRLVLPGVGAFGAGMASLRARGLDAAVREAAEGGTPLLAICLGLQLLCEASEESPGVAGIELIPGTCRRLPEGVRVPHLGWNRVEPDAGFAAFEAGFAAYANSYALREAPAGWRAAWTVHGAPFVAALERGGVLACQFHPELSGGWGAEVIAKWLGLSAAGIHPHSPAPASTRGEGENGDAIRRIVPCLDVREGRVVKGIQFSGLRDVGDPAECAALYEAQGADEIVVLDIAASPGARETQVETVRRVRAALGIPLTVGGGVRTVEDARRLLAAGADKVSVNTAAVARPELLAEMAAEFGRQCVVLAIDARRVTVPPERLKPQLESHEARVRGLNGAYAPDPSRRRPTSCPSSSEFIRPGEAIDARQQANAPEPAWEVLVMGGRESAGLDAVGWARRGVELGAGEILLTSWDRDGTRAGHDLELLAAVTDAVRVPVIASGGIGTRAHAAEAFEAGAEAVLAASIFHDGDDTVSDLKVELRERGIAVRP